MNFLNQPNLFFIIKKSKIIELIEMIKPNIINGLDFSLTFCSRIFLDEDNFLSSFILKRLEKGLLTTKFKN
mgnify:CR=1 FL=1